MDFDAKEYPEDDIMSYQYDPNQVHCVSNLNVEGIEGVFARTLARPPAEWLVPGTTVDMDPSRYTQVACANPAIAFLP